MRTKTLVATLSLVLFQTVANAASTPSPMTPSGPWHVEYAGSMCLLSRPYGTNPNVRLILKPSMIGDELEIIVSTDRSWYTKWQSGSVAITIADKPVADQVNFDAYSTARQRLVRIGSDSETLTLAALRDTLSIDAKREGHYQFALPGIERARPALNSCLAQLRTMYNVTKADLAPIVTEPQAKIWKFFRSSDYPLEALNKRQSGRVGVLLWVESTGLVSKCEVIERIDAPVLEQQTCSILQSRGRFTAAKDAAGRSIRAPVTTRLNWQLPY